MTLKHKRSTMTGYAITNENVKKLINVNLSGMVIPFNWLDEIQFTNGKTDILGIILLADIFAWSRPSIVKDEITNEIIEYTQKFKADKLQKSYSEYSDKFSVSKKTIKRSIDNLERLKLISKEFRKVKFTSYVASNVMYIDLILPNIFNIGKEKIKVKKSKEKQALIKTSQHPIDKQSNRVLTNKAIPYGQTKIVYSNSLTENTYINNKEVFSKKEKTPKELLNRNNSFSNKKEKEINNSLIKNDVANNNIFTSKDADLFTKENNNSFTSEEFNNFTINKKVIICFNEWMSRKQTIKHGFNTKVYKESIKRLKELFNKTLFVDIEGLEDNVNINFTFTDWQASLNNYEISFGKEYKTCKYGLSTFLYNPYGLGNFKSPFLYYLRNKPTKRNIANLKDNYPDMSIAIMQTFNIAEKTPPIITASKLMSEFFQKHRNKLDNNLLNYTKQLELCKKAVESKDKTWGFGILTQDWFYNTILYLFLQDGNYFVNKIQVEGLRQKRIREKIAEQKRQLMEAQ